MGAGRDMDVAPAPRAPIARVATPGISWRLHPASGLHHARSMRRGPRLATTSLAVSFAVAPAVGLASGLAAGLAVLLAAGLAACGGDDGGGVPMRPDAGPHPGDAGPPPSCEMRISLTPAMPRAPTDLMATAEIVSESLAGFQTFAWQVRFGDQILEPALAPDGRQITFPATQPGAYDVFLEGSVDGYPCIDAERSIAVAAADATSVSYRLRFVPGPDQPAVIHERTDTLVAGLDYDLGRVTLPSGIPVSGSIHSPAGDPLAAYVRATRSDAVPVEAFADASGTFSMRLESASFDLLVVPVDLAHAPARFPVQPAGAPWSLFLPPSTIASGTVLDREGARLPGARVSLRIDGAPATVAVTDDQGAFSLPVRAGSEAALLVVPPADTGLPWLELAPSSGLTGALAGALAGGDPLTIAYTAGLADHEVAPTALDAGGAALGGVRATWIARAVTAPGGAPAGTVTAGAGPGLALAGTTRVTAIAQPGGAWLPLRLPEAVYDVVLEPDGGTAASGAVTVRVVDLAATPAVDTLSLALPALVRGKVVDSDGNALTGIPVTASPRGLLAHSPAAGAAAGTDSEGAFALALAPDTEYELVVDSPDRGHGRARVAVPATAADQSLDLPETRLSPAARLRGEVALLEGAGGAAGITVLLSCLGCDDPAPLAEAVTDGTGAFVLAVPYSAATP
jgi:hypothetical protein